MLATCACAQSCPILHDPMNCSSPGSSVHEISQATTLERVAISYCRGPSWPRDWTCLPYVACIGRRILCHRRHLVDQKIKNPRAMPETWAGSVGEKDPLEEGTGTPFGVLAWRIPMDRRPWRATVHGMGSQE